jgi:hypothetical protein
MARIVSIFPEPWHSLLPLLEPHVGGGAIYFWLGSTERRFTTLAPLLLATSVALASIACLISCDGTDPFRVTVSFCETTTTLQEASDNFRSDFKD